MYIPVQSRGFDSPQIQGFSQSDVTQAKQKVRSNLEALVSDVFVDLARIAAGVYEIEKKNREDRVEDEANRIKLLSFQQGLYESNISFSDSELSLPIGGFNGAE